MNLTSRDRRPFAAPDRDVTLIHSSDIHVSEGFTEPLYQGDGTAGLRGVLACARALAADAVILAGDTFEHNRLSSEILDRAGNLIAAAGMPVVILPGNHDPAIAQSVFHHGALAGLQGLSVLGVTHDAAVLFPALALEVWGNAHRDYGDMDPLGATRPRTSFWQVAVAHGHFEPLPDRSTRLRPSWLIGAGEIEATQADYVALGHWNRHARVGSGAVEAQYSGSPDHAGTVNRIRLQRSGEVLVTRERIEW
ncbi:MAG TPA: metallophosphoesterase [Stellaceae bacterium]|nr:metallophosphoesterase [Stellaceae bacterium]